MIFDFKPQTAHCRLKQKTAAQFTVWAAVWATRFSSLGAAQRSRRGGWFFRAFCFALEDVAGHGVSLEGRKAGWENKKSPHSVRAFRFSFCRRRSHQRKKPARLRCGKFFARFFADERHAKHGAFFQLCCANMDRITPDCQLCKATHQILMFMMLDGFGI